MIKSGDDSAKEMMLVGKASDAQSICFCALGNILPIDIHCDVGISDLFKRRIEIAVAGADLNAVPASRMAVIDRNHIATLQVCRDLVDPAHCCLVENRPMKRLLDEGKLVAIEIHQSLSSVSD